MHTRTLLRRRLLIGAAAVAVLAAVDGPAAQRTAQAEPQAASVTAPVMPRFLVTSGALSLIESVDAQVATTVFDTPATLIAGRLPSGWAATRASIFQSYATFATRVANREVAANTRVVVYDIEGWSLTPLAEQLDPGTYEQRFCALAHSQGYLCMTAPAVSLITVQPWYLPGVNAWQQFVGHGYATTAARYADLVDVQAQWSETSPWYANIVSSVAASARSANPAIVVFAGLSTGPSGQTVTGQQLYDAAHSTMDFVAGYWLNVPQQGIACQLCAIAQPGAAVTYLTLVEQQGW